MRYLHCRKCVEANKPNQIEVSIDSAGLQINCRRHKLQIVQMTPELLREFMANEPECFFCKQGVPHTH
jgi:hypothetical protein